MQQVKIPVGDMTALEGPTDTEKCKLDKELSEIEPNTH